jgi:aminopeptidase-like protein
MGWPIRGADSGYPDTGVNELALEMDRGNTGRQMYRLIEELYPICRSITGDGVRQTLAVLKEHIPLQTREVPTGTQVFDWVVPKEWNIRGAYLADRSGNRIVDFKDNNLHVLNYSVPARKRVALEELRPHLFTSAEHPDWVPYRTSYYQENWGFCMTHRQYMALKDEEYEVNIDSTLQDGAMTLGELVVPGESSEEILVSTHTCHPSLCNDNLSGIALCTFLAKQLMGTRPRYTYRFLFIPGTIGSITWLALNEDKLANISMGIVVTLVGDSGGFVYKKTRTGDSLLDAAVLHTLKHSGASYSVREFIPYGYDERQYSSPGINLDVGCLTRTPFGEFPQYHTSADNLDFVKPDKLAEALSVYQRVFHVLENNRCYRNLNPKCEPQLGRRGLYNTTGGTNERQLNQMAILWALNYSDERHSLLQIADKAGLPFEDVRFAADRLLQCNLLEEVGQAV